MMTSMTMRILKDEKLFMLINTSGDVEDESNEEEEDSESVDCDTEWNEFQNIVTETKFRVFC